MAGIFTNLKTAIESTAGKGASNPIIPILAADTGLDEQTQQIVSAKLGFALRVVHADGQVDDGEKKFLTDLINQYTELDANAAQKVMERLVLIGNDALNMDDFAQILINNTTEADRKELLTALFTMATADDDFDIMEEKDLEMITKYLLLNQFDFYAERQNAQERAGG